MFQNPEQFANATKTLFEFQLETFNTLTNRAMYKASARGCSLLAQAPTGIGKSIGSIFPMLKASAEHGLDKVFFLAAKTSGRGMMNTASLLAPLVSARFARTFQRAINSAAMTSATTASDTNALSIACVVVRVSGAMRVGRAHGPSTNIDVGRPR